MCGQLEQGSGCLDIPCFIRCVLIDKGRVGTVKHINEHESVVQDDQGGPPEQVYGQR